MWISYEAFESVIIKYWITTSVRACYGEVERSDCNLYVVNICKHCLGSQECTQLFNQMVHSEGLMMTP